MKINHSGNAARNLLGLMLAAMVLLMAAPARAAVYTGIWDPTYGDPFTNLGWRGNATFYVPDSCVSTGTADVNNLSACGGAAAVTFAEVDLYDTTNPTQNLATLIFAPASLGVDTLRYVDGALTELATTLSNFLVPDADLSNYGVPAGTDFSLQFTLDGPSLAWGTCNFTNEEGCVVLGRNDGAQFPPNFVITQVPEPGVLWLTGIALGGVVLTRHRGALKG